MRALSPTPFRIAVVPLLLLLADALSAQTATPSQEVAAFAEPGVRPLNQESAEWATFVNVLESDDRKDLENYIADKEFNPELRNGIGRNMLHQAVMDGNLNAVKLLLDAGVDPNATDSLYGNTPLHEAALKGYTDIGAYLLKNGARIGVRGKDGAAAIHLAAGNDQEAFVDLLIANGANVNARDKEDITPLHCAVLSGNANICAKLLKANAVVDSKTIESWDMAGGTTPLHLAAMQGNAEIAGLLMDAGADLNALNRDGLTPLNLAYAQKQTAVAKLIESRGGKY